MLTVNLSFSVAFVWVFEVSDMMIAAASSPVFAA